MLEMHVGSSLHDSSTTRHLFFPGLSDNSDSVRFGTLAEIDEHLPHFGTRQGEPQGLSTGPAPLLGIETSALQGA
jgi:hypothetical protein